MSQRSYAVSAIVAITLGAVVLATGSVYALWTASGSTKELTATPTLTGLAVQRDGGQVDYATAQSNTARLFLTTVDANALVAADGNTIAVPFTVTMMTSGTDGMDYSIALGTPDPGSFLADASMSVFPVAAGGCTAGATPDDPAASLTDITGVPASAIPRAPGTVASQSWCLTVTRPVGTYETDASVTGTDQMGGLLQGTTTWQVSTGPDPGLQRPVSIALTYKTTRPGGS